MLLLIVLPFFLSLWWLTSHSPGETLVDVCLPVIVLVPIFYYLYIPHMMSFGAHDFVLLPVLAVTIYKYGGSWRFHRCDVWVFFFILGVGYANGRQQSTLGIRAFFQTMLEVGAPYVIGRLLLERERLREPFLRRLCWLLALVAVISVVEFTTGKNLFTLAYGKLFSLEQPNPEQLRGGFTRSQGPFGHAIYAGILYASGLIFAFWLSYMDRRRLGDKEKRILGVRRSYVLLCLLFLGLLVAYSRGPWIGAIFSFGIWLVARSKNVRRTAVVMGILGAIAGVALYVFLNAYTSGVALTPDQQNAVYRRDLLSSYTVIANAGGIFGWGVDFPRLPYESSIDNQYLLAHLVGGLFGLWIFNLISFEGCLAILLKARRATHKEDFSFYLTLLAVLGGILLILASVALDMVAREFFFLLIGWSLSLQATQPGDVPEQAGATPEYRFRRIIA